MEKNKLSKKIKVLLLVISILLFIFLIFLFIKRSDKSFNIFESNIKKVSTINYNRFDLECNEEICNIGKIKLDEEYVSVSYSVMNDVFVLYINNKTVYNYDLENIIYFKSINGKYILIKKREVVLLEEGEEDVINYDFIDKDGNILDYEEIIDIDLSEVD